MRLTVKDLVDVLGILDDLVAVVLLTHAKAWNELLPRHELLLVVKRFAKTVIEAQSGGAHILLLSKQSLSLGVSLFEFDCSYRP